LCLEALDRGSEDIGSKFYWHVVSVSRSIGYLTPERVQKFGPFYRLP
jgi:hypothetical protein